MVNSLNGINLNNPFENKLDKIIEYFVEFYGEKYRQRITDRLRNAIFVFVDDANENRITLANNYFKEREEMLLNQFKVDAGQALHIKDIAQIPQTFLADLQSWSKEIKEDDYPRVYMFFKLLSGKKIPDISFKKMEKTFQKTYFLHKSQINTTIKTLAKLYKDKYEQEFIALNKEKTSVLTPPIIYQKKFNDTTNSHDKLSFDLLRDQLKFYIKSDIEEFLPVIKK